MRTRQGVSIDEFRSGSGPILDVRSPVEFNRGHIPGAQNFPLFSDKEREKIGICYKKEGREAAIALGFEVVGPKLADLVRTATELSADKKVRIHCARGGMRSRSVQWLLETAGISALILDGGYKSYRRRTRELFENPRRIILLGGLTGTGKTDILKKLREQGGQIVDLEGLASHRGSSFGGLSLPDQPTTQQFENRIAEILTETDPEKPLWIEAESGRIGNCWIPEGLFSRMKSSPSIEINRSIEERLDNLTRIYGDSNREDLTNATKRIAQRLGGARTKAAVELIANGDLREACRIILDYYDRSYNFGRRRIPVAEIDVSGLTSDQAAKLLTQKTAEFFKNSAFFA
ncbi:MAG: tRNA 2-selenouridine(34) synthase MnmH [Pyrinomonadaceae bacterium]